MAALSSLCLQLGTCVCCFLKTISHLKAMFLASVKPHSSILKKYLNYDIMLSITNTEQLLHAFMIELNTFHNTRSSHYIIRRMAFKLK